MCPRRLLALITGPLLLLLVGHVESVASTLADRVGVQPAQPVPAIAPAAARTADGDWKLLQQQLSRLAAEDKLAEQVDLLRPFIQGTKDTELRLVAMLELAQLLGDRRLNRLTEAEVVARQILELQPSEPSSYVTLSQILYDQERLADAADVLRAERKHVPDAAGSSLYWSVLAENLIEQVRRSPQLARDAAGPLLSEAADASTQALRLIEKNPSHSDVDMSVALGDRALILDLQAALVEQTETGRAALMAESQRLAKESSAVLRKPTAAAQTPSPTEEEWRTIYQQSSQQFREGKFDQAANAIRAFIRLHPDFQIARIALGVFQMQRVSDDKTMARELARAFLTDAVAVLDEALRRNPDYVEALTYKALVLRLQAERVEVDAARAGTLNTEATRLIDRAKELNRQKMH
jgi:tetratricopeptide (TPR) repeat protein